LRFIFNNFNVQKLRKPLLGYWVDRQGGIKKCVKYSKISDHQQSWGYEDGPWKGPKPSLLVAADLIHKPPASIKFIPMKHALAVSVEPFKFSPA
jgi:hypothetical protein